MSACNLSLARVVVVFSFFIVVVVVVVVIVVIVKGPANYAGLNASESGQMDTWSRSTVCPPAISPVFQPRSGYSWGG
ncbi:hypothetical protein LX36DRAFT_663589 [Colletotrichum falcatum]|nr:hypothetical protein LX36DRAFT_663589 [Colletotrichum falcatum]